MVLGKKFLVFVLLVLLLTLLVIKGQALQRARPDLKRIYIDKNLVWVKVAQTDQEKQQGLSGVKKLAEDEGMLFILAKKQIPYFWMKGMFFPLDFIWIADGKVVDLMENLPLPDSTSADKIPGCSPKEPVDMVLEVNAGFVKKHGLKIGDTLKF